MEGRRFLSVIVYPGDFPTADFPEVTLSAKRPFYYSARVFRHGARRGRFSRVFPVWQETKRRR